MNMMAIYRLHGVDVFSHACSLSSVSEAHIRQVTSQLLCAIDYLQSRYIVHCDIKVNIVVIQVNMNFTVMTKIGFAAHCQSANFHIRLWLAELMSSPTLGSRPSWSLKATTGIQENCLSPFFLNPDS